MAMILKQSTAVDVLIGPFVDKTDGLTAETGESPPVKLSKNGQALGAKSDVTTPVHDADGYHNCELDATDTNTVGTLVLTVVGSAEALPVRHEFQVVEEDTFEYLYASGAAPDTQIAAIKSETALIVADTNELQVDNIPGTLSSMDGKLDTIDNFLDTEIAAITAAVITNAAGADIAADIIAVKAETVLIVADTNEVQSDNVPGLIAALNDPTAAVIADAVWDEAQADHVAALSFGLIATEIAAIPTTAMRGTDSAATAAALATHDTKLDTADAAIDVAVADLANATDGLGALKTLIDALNDAPAVTAATIADAIWDEAQADHVAVGSFGITASETASILSDTTAILVDTMTTLQAELDAIQAAVITNAAGADIAADIIAMKAETALIVADSNELQTDWANGGRLDVLIDAIKLVTDLLNAADAEPTGVPAANETPLIKLAYLFMVLRNKVTITSSKKTFFGDDDVAEFEQDLTDDGTTFTQTEANVI